MNAPDKIYVIEGEILECKTTPFNYVENIEYIRKDALLEWLKIAEEYYSHPDTANVVDMIRCEGKKWAIQDVINEIESL